MRISSFRILLRYPFVCISPHPILNELCRDICTGLHNDSFRGQKLIWVFCGAHKSFPIFRFLPGKHLYIQTEQLSDINGRRLWGIRNRNIVKNIKANLKKSHVFLDINTNNRDFYNHLDIDESDKLKIVVGPYIFPSLEVPFCPASERNKLIFFGSMNERRSRIINNISLKFSNEINVIPEKTYGKRLQTEIRNCSAVVNIHYDEGTYTEVPRVLSTYLKGKPIVSETLAEPFKKNIHYANLNDLSERDDEAIFESLSQLVTTQLSFKSFISTYFAN